MKAVDFYQLPRSVQDRFVACVLGSAEPRPIVSSKAPPTKLLAWGLTAFLSLGLLLFLADLGFGSLGEPFAVQPIEFMGGYIALTGALFFAIGKAAAFWSASLALPFPPGIYLFPGCLIDATSATFRVFPMAELARTDAPPGKVQSFRVVFGKESFDFLMGPGQKITAVDKAVAEGRAAMATAELDGGEQQRYALDPLVEMKFSSPLGPKDAMVREASLLEAWLLPVVGLTAVLLGGVGFFARNRASDDRLYAAAKSRNDAESFRAYLALGTRHRNAVETILLPRAELSEAQAKGTLAALEQYRDNHPSSQIMAEVNDALRKAELRELEAAKAQGTLAALELFSTKHPDHGVKKEWAAAKHAIYTKALGEFRGRANSKDTDMLKWFDALITHAEAHGPKVEVHFRRRSNGTLDEADAAISKSSRFRGPSSLPSHYFDDAHLEAAEREAGTALVELLQKPFSKEVLEFEFGPALSEANPLKTPTKVPMVLVDYELQWGGSVFAFRDPKGAILGFNVVFDGLFALPPGERGHRFRAESWRAPDSKLWKSLTEDDIQLGEGDHTREGRVYETMRRDAFNLLVRKTSGVLYRASAP